MLLASARALRPLARTLRGGNTLRKASSATTMSDTRTAASSTSEERCATRRRRDAASHRHFDYLVIGAGSGGIASARRAATHGAKVAVCEKGALGGTCVNVGCVPKKVMYNAAHIMECVHDAPLYQYSGTDSVKLDWNKLKTARDNYVTRLNGIYGRNMEGSGVTKLEGLASFSGPNEVEVAGQKYTADHILVAVGGKPTMPADLEGVEHCISSDGFFLLEEMPASALVVGAGYIAVEMAGILHALGCKTELAVRGEKPLRAFDDLMSDTLVCVRRPFLRARSRR